MHRNAQRNVIARTKKQNFKLIFSLGVLFALTPFSIDLYLPAFLKISEDIHAPLQSMPLTVSIYFMGFALGQILYGPFLDRYGRKWPTFIGILIYILSSIGCYTAESLDALLLFRFTSALGGSVLSVAAVTMVRDYFPAEKVSQIISFLMLVLSASPLIAPSVGGLIIENHSWRIVFLILIFMALSNAVILARLPHSYDPDETVSIRFGPILKQYFKILRQRQFRTYVVAGALSFVNLFVYISSSPAIFIEGFKLTTRQFGGVFAFATGGMVLGSQLNHILLKYYDSKSLFQRALILQTALSLLFLIFNLLMPPSLFATVLFIFLILVCTGVASPNASAVAIAPLTKNIGSAASLFGFIELGVGALGAAALSFFSATSLPLSAIICTSSTLGLVILTFSLRKPTSN